MRISNHKIERSMNRITKSTHNNYRMQSIMHLILSDKTFQLFSFFLISDGVEAFTN